MNCTSCGSNNLRLEGVDPSRYFSSYLCDDCNERVFAPREFASWKQKRDKLRTTPTQVVRTAESVFGTGMSTTMPFAQPSTTPGVFAEPSRQQEQPAAASASTGQRQAPISIFGEPTTSDFQLSPAPAQQQQPVSAITPEPFPVQQAQPSRRIVISHAVADEILAESKAAVDSGPTQFNQTFGVLMGTVEETLTISQSLHLRTLEEMALGLTEEDLPRISAAQSGGIYLVGWYHSHSVGGLAPTPSCISLHRDSFLASSADSVGLICDPNNETDPFFLFTVLPNGTVIPLELIIA